MQKKALQAVHSACISNGGSLSPEAPGKASNEPSAGNYKTVPSGHHHRLRKDLLGVLADPLPAVRHAPGLGWQWDRDERVEYTETAGSVQPPPTCKREVECFVTQILVSSQAEEVDGLQVDTPVCQQHTATSQA